MLCYASPVPLSEEALANPSKPQFVATLFVLAISWLITYSLFGWLVADGWCWFVLREGYCWLIAGGWFVLREKYCWLVADKPSEQGVSFGGSKMEL
jgi:hypothetical protein